MPLLTIQPWRLAFVSRFVIQAAVDAAKSQHTIVPAQHMGEGIVAALAREILALNVSITHVQQLGTHMWAMWNWPFPGSQSQQRLASGRAAWLSL